MRKALSCLLFFILSVLPAQAENMPLSKLALSDQPVFCTFQKKDRKESRKGTVFVAKPRMRGDFESEKDGKKTRSHLILDSAWAWSWSGPAGEERGAKTPRAEAAGLDQADDYECKPWSVDAGVFNVPTEVDFTATGGQGSILTQLNGGLPEMKAAQCASCKQADGVPAQVACREVLGCE